MKCSYCGFESAKDYQYCPQCGTAIEKKEQDFYSPPQSEYSYEQPTPQPEHTITIALKDKLFLAVCVLVSVCCGLSILNLGLPLIRIFLAVFLWVAYTQAKNNTLTPSHIRNISGTVYASYILNNVLGVLFIIFGLFFSFLFTTITSNKEMLDLFYKELETTGGSEIVELFSQYIASFAGFIGIVISVIGIIIIVLNIIGRKSIHKFVKSIYLNMGMPTEQIQKVSKAQVWLIVFGVFYAISALSSASTMNPTLMLSDLSFAAALIIIAILVKKYFSNKTN
ncbi:MAG: zinc ribbon domain-containing protein [Clostridia bacterium]|nr:zinc ribbon domain-containing protein [Clostridia bacterium]